MTVVFTKNELVNLDDTSMDLSVSDFVIYWFCFRLPRNRRSPPISPQNEFENLRPESPPQQQPTVPQDVAQPVFMGYFRLVTHEVFGEMQRKRAERKRRSTANPHFVYGNRGWDFFGPPTVSCHLAVFTVKLKMIFLCRSVNVNS